MRLRTKLERLGSVRLRCEWIKLSREVKFGSSGKNNRIKNHTYIGDTFDFFPYIL